MTTRGIQETERKFDYAPARRVPDLTGAGPVARQRDPVERLLEATYFDTPGHRLHAAGITLRRRTGGADAGWHLKLPVAADTREEVQLPLGGDPNRAPGELRKLVAAYLGGEPLVPVAHLKTLRFEHPLLDGTGQELATLTDDHVTGDSGGAAAHLDSWRELEVELAQDAPPKLLDELSRALKKAGARKAAHASKLARLLGPTAAHHTGVPAYLDEQIDALRRADIGVRRDEPDSVHQLRVAARRLRSVLRSYCARDDIAGLASDLQWLGRRLALARDTEVLAERLDHQLGEIPSELVLGEVRAFLTRQAAHDAAEGRDRALETLTGKRYKALLRELARLREAPPRIVEKPANAVRKAARKLRRAEKGTHGVEEGPELDAALHDVRKKAKRARYAAEAASGKKHRKWRKRFKAVQKVLGEHQDTVVTRDALRRLALISYDEGGNAFTYGLLHARNAAAAIGLRRKFDAHRPTIKKAVKKL